MTVTEVLDRMYGQISALELALIAALEQLPAEQRQAVVLQLQTVDASTLYTDASDVFVEGFGTTATRLAKHLGER